MAVQAESGVCSLKGGAGLVEEVDGAKGPEEEPATVPLSSPPALPSSEETECPVCRSPFDLERHAPKLLECLHTFCRECLRQLHLRAAAAATAPLADLGQSAVDDQERSPGGFAEQGAAAAAAVLVSCPLCRHRTLLSNARLGNLPVNTRLAKTFSLPRNHRRPLQVWPSPGPAPAPARPLGELPIVVQLGQRATRPAALSAESGLMFALPKMCRVFLGLLLVVGVAFFIRMAVEYLYNVIVVVFLPFFFLALIFCFCSWPRDT